MINISEGSSPRQTSSYSMASGDIADILPKSVKTSDRRQPRQKLRPWLIDQINRGDIPGLEWLDPIELKFKIPWKHFGRPKVNVNEDSELFRRWAIHTKKFREGDKWDISTWKTRLRCALHKVTDIEEVPELNQKSGNQPYRVYRFTKKEIKVENCAEQEDTSYSSKESGEVSKKVFREECDHQSANGYAEQSGKEEGKESDRESLSLTSKLMCQNRSWWTDDSGEQLTLPFQSKSHNDEMLKFGNNDLGCIDINLENILNELDSLMEQSENYVENKVYNPFSDPNLTQMNTHVSVQQQKQYQNQPHQHPYQNQDEQQKQQQQQQQKQQQEQQQQNSRPQFPLGKQEPKQEQLQELQAQQQQVEDNRFLKPMISTLQSPQVSSSAEILFTEERINSVEVKLYYKDEEMESHIVDNINGARIAFKPPPLLHHDIVPEAVMCYGPVNAKQILFPSAKDPYVAKILSCMSRGLVLQFCEGQVLATRLCQAKVYYSESEFFCSDELPRQRTVVVFDYKRDFLQKFQQYKLGDGERPTYQRYFSFAQSWSTTSPLNKNYVRCTMTHSLAQKKFEEFEHQTPIDFKISSLNQLDEIAHQFEDINFQE